MDVVPEDPAREAWGGRGMGISWDVKLSACRHCCLHLPDDWWSIPPNLRDSGSYNIPRSKGSGQLVIYVSVESFWNCCLVNVLELGGACPISISTTALVKLVTKKLTFFKVHGEIATEFV